MGFIKKNFVLIIILIISFVVRVVGLTYSLPLSTVVGDEIVITAGSLRMLAEKTLVLSFPHSDYFPLAYYFYLPVLVLYILYLRFFSSYHSFGAIKELGILQTGKFLIAGRIVSVLFGALSVLLIYLISQNLFKNKRISLIASSLFALSPLNVLMSHFARVWSVQIFFILLTFLFLLKFFSQKADEVGSKKFIMAGLLLGLTFMTHVIGVLIYVSFLAIVFYSFESERLKNFLKFLKSRKFIIFHIPVALSVAASYLINQTSFNGFFASGFIDNVIKGQNFFNTTFSGRWLYYFKIFLNYETAVFLLALVGFFLLYKYQRRIFWIVFLGFLPFYLYLGPLTAVTQARYSLPMIPFLVLASAYLINFVWEKTGIKMAVILLAVSLIPVAFLSFKMDKVFSQESSDVTVYNWMKNNLSTGSKILFINNYFLQDVILTKESISKIKEYSPAMFSARMKYLLNKPDSLYPEPAWDVYQDPIICDRTPKEIKNFKPDYIVASEGILKEVTSLGRIEVCDKKIIINLKKENIIYESPDETFFDSDYSYQKEDHSLETLKYFSGIEKLGPKYYIYKN